jgi:hypothetical protein
VIERRGAANLSANPVFLLKFLELGHKHPLGNLPLVNRHSQGIQTMGGSNLKALADVGGVGRRGRRRRFLGGEDEQK